jgi:hypothetical protein
MKFIKKPVQQQDAFFIQKDAFGAMHGEPEPVSRLVFNLSRCSRSWTATKNYCKYGCPIILHTVVDQTVVK